MKRALSLILSLMLVLALCGCGKASRPVSFPLDDDKIAVTVTELGLPWELSADECLSYSEDQRTCVLRDTTETYAEGGSKLLRAAISSGNSGGGDYMFANFEGTPQTEEPELDWAYWKKQLRLTEMLWGMEDGQLYNILSEKPEPDRVVSQDVSTQGTVIILYGSSRLRAASASTSTGAAIRRHSQAVRRPAAKSTIGDSASA